MIYYSNLLPNWIKYENSRDVSLMLQGNLSEQSEMKTCAISWPNNIPPFNCITWTGKEEW